ncbi:MAG: glucose-1-phosphate thymidylyltransferase RfbA [Alphaproteobacteria bacterium]|nr:glucose-1-phosphate thymidylyltransferase RfbA [Alphaproteobacteria bacterium]
MIRKGIILAGGTGSRLYPMTQVVTKQLLPVFDKPMIYYPLSILMMKGVQDILIIIKPEDQHLFEKLLGDGSQWGIRISYKVQLAPRGLPEAFTLGRDFIGNDPVILILGDNIFYGSGFIKHIMQMEEEHKGASIFTFRVKDPSRFGVVNFDSNGNIVDLEEKPQNPRSDWAASGLYLFDPDVVERAASLKPSERGELEIVDLLLEYHKEGRLKAARAPRGFAWLDTGTPGSMMQASQYIHIVEERQGIKIACLEEIAYQRGLISFEKLKMLASQMGNNAYAEYIRSIVNDHEH